MISPVPQDTQPNSLRAPKLRFSEFSSCWKNDSLVEIAVGGFSNGVFNDPKKVGSGYRLINVKDMYLSDTINPKTLELIAISKEEFLKNKSNFGDIFFTRSSLVKEGIAHSNVLLENLSDITYDGHLIKMSVDHGIFDPFFVHKLLKTDSIRRQLVARGKTGTMTTIGQDDLSTVKLTYPSLPEQQKIAHFLRAVDARAGLLLRRQQALAAYKKAMMQGLFARTLRFTKPDGSTFPDWQEKRLGEIAETITGNSNREDSTEEGEYVFFDRSSDVRASSRFLLDGEAIIVAGEGKDFPPRYFVGRFDLHQRTYATMGFGANSGKFLFYWIGWHRAHFLKHSVGSTMPSLRMGSFSNFPVSLPHPDEQQKIAQFITALDTKIEAVAAQIDAMQRFKQGLLQQMFV